VEMGQLSSIFGHDKTAGETACPTPKNLIKKCRNSRRG